MKVERNIPSYLTAIPGVTCDFCDGLRIHVSDSAPSDCDVAIFDETNKVLAWHGTVAHGSMVSTKIKYFNEWSARIQTVGQGPEDTIHFDPTDQLVVFDVSSSALGDAIAWFAGVPDFVAKHKCRPRVLMRPQYIELFCDSYPDIEFQTPDYGWTGAYALYRMGAWKDDPKRCHCPYDYRQLGMLGITKAILGLDKIPEHPKVWVESTDQHVNPYVTIASKGSAMTKCWMNPMGWYQLNNWLQSIGYDVMCIDRDQVFGTGLTWQPFPPGAIDNTGEFSLRDRVNTIAHSEFFIGMPSGLSWLAWTVGVPVVLISGFSGPWAEFDTPYRVINENVCHACWTDPTVHMPSDDICACPEYKGTDLQYICTRMITAQKVAEVIKTIPSVQEHLKFAHGCDVQPDRSPSILQLMKANEAVEFN